jgi:hypothetical protein
MNINSLSISFCDANPISQSNRELAVETYRKALFAQVPSLQILSAIHNDDKSGTEAGLDHFENCRSAWSELDRIAMNAVVAKLGFWPNETAHFEVVF